MAEGKLLVRESEDGERRATIRVEFRVGLEEIARAIGYALEFETSEAVVGLDPADALAALARADVLAAARTMHHEFGMVGVDSAAGENVDRMGLSKDDLSRRAAELFPEFLQVVKKHCGGCGADKPIREFAKCKKSADGYGWRCRACSIATARRWRKKNAERVREQNRANPKRVQWAKDWRKRNPKQYAAQCAVRSAVRYGTLSKPDRCQRCGQVAEPREIHGHHHDYDKPLEVEWLCRACHDEAHGRVPGGAPVPEEVG
jgi:hypothetical protein